MFVTLIIIEAFLALIIFNSKTIESSAFFGKQQNRVKLFCFLASLLWIIISGLRGLNVGSDTLQYKNTFNIFF